MRMSGRRSHRSWSPQMKSVNAAVERLEERRLLSIQGVSEDPGAPAHEVHLYDNQGHHLALDGLPDAGTIDIPPGTAPAPGFIGPLKPPSVPAIGPVKPVTTPAKKAQKPAPAKKVVKKSTPAKSTTAK